MERKTGIRWAGLVVLIILLAAGAVFYYIRFLKVEPAPLLEEVMKKAYQAESYRYELKADLDMAGKKKSWIKVQGECASDGYHFKGETLGTPVEIYQIGLKSYTKDPVSGKWTVLEGVDLTQQQLFMAEIDPLSSFRFKTMEEPRLIGKEKVEGRKCWVLEAKADVESKYMQTWWQDFTYRFWIDRGKHVLLKAQATAKSKNSSDTTLTMTVNFRDFNKKIKISPPI